MTTYLDPESYTHLCPECRALLASLTATFGEGEDSDDDEAPCNYMYDHALFCQGRECYPAA
jgi:hypothetical protein